MGELAVIATACGFTHTPAPSRQGRGGSTYDVSMEFDLVPKVHLGNANPLRSSNFPRMQSWSFAPYGVPKLELGNQEKVGENISWLGKKKWGAVSIRPPKKETQECVPGC
ncbi:hypothetical protein GMPD_21470 [Geomonas paludis]|uniref:Uncharacterized protein n=1 Tax=Geomonas paludis TaxID=2740185 RepID=A0A6V8MVL8_9BACT|nr:hypothetical protein GMPD_21470 [Geomonas paludis]